MDCVKCCRLSCGSCYVLKVPVDCAICCRFLWTVLCCRFLWTVLCVVGSFGLCSL